MRMSVSLVVTLQEKIQEVRSKFLTENDCNFPVGVLFSAPAKIVVQVTLRYFISNYRIVVSFPYN